jgi:predicted ATP-dependent protease
VDQQGNIQPIGGANEKIEGFFLTCQHKGLTGEQGVILPQQNVVNLMLRADVRQAVAEGKFHIYPVRTIDQGIEILTGAPAGEPDQDGAYPDGSVHGRVMARLEEIAENLKGIDEEKEQEDGKEGNPGEPAQEAESEGSPDSPEAAGGEGDQAE